MSTLMEDRKSWFKTSHERKVEKFYGHGAENYTDFHDSYLNFGLWDSGITDYIAAAENLVSQIGAFCGLDAQSRLLDVACGFGTQDIFLTRTFSPASIDGVDVTWPHVEQARTRAREAGFEDRVRFHHGTATKLEFPEDSFSHVLSIEGPVHFDTREKFMREAQRVLKPGGVIAMADYTLKRPPRTATEKLIIQAARRMWKIPQENVDSVESYTRKLERSGFTNVEVNEIGERVIPGYYYEHQRPEAIREITRIRGTVHARLALLIDRAAFKAFRMGLIDYIFVRAEKSN